MIRRRTIGFALFVVCLFVQPSFSANVASDAATPPACPTMLEAVLTLPEPAAAPGATEWLTAEVMEDLRTVPCDGVSLTGVSLSVGEATNGTVQLKLKGKAQNGSDRDIEVDLLVELLRGETRLAFYEAEDIEIEEDEDRGWKATLKPPADGIRAEPRPQLRITLRRH